MTSRIVRAPAKINLGLEILGRRSDGYHEIRSILCKITLHDTLTFSNAVDGRDRVTFLGSDPGISNERNLIIQALAASRDAGAAIPPQSISVEKRIPAAAGLGGASSNAASTLKAFATELQTANADTDAVAASLGSDVPFFLGGPIALVSGRGEQLKELPLPRQDCWVVLATPKLDIPNKTKTMYGAIERAWWSDGSAVARYAEALSDWATPPPPNTFEHAFLQRFPQMDDFRKGLLALGFPFVALTGAGPSFYTLVESESVAREFVSRADDGTADPSVAKLGWNGN